MNRGLSFYFAMKDKPIVGSCFKLQDSFMFYTLSPNKRDLISQVKKYQEEYKRYSKSSFFVCKGIISRSDAITALTCCMIGNSFRDCNVLVTDVSFVP